MKGSHRKFVVVSLLVFCMTTSIGSVLSKDKKDLGKGNSIKRKGTSTFPSKIQEVKDKDLIEIWEMRRLGSSAVKSLIPKLKDKKESVRREAAWALGQIGDARAVQPLVATLKDGNRFVRLKAVQALGNIGDPRATESLVAAMKDPYVIGSAAEALGKIGDRRAILPLIDMLDDKLGFWAASALYQLNYQREKQMTRLLATLNDENWRLRGEAALALAITRDSRGVAPLIAALRDKDSRSRKYVISALWKLTGEKFGQDYEKWRNWWKQNKESFKPEAVKYYLRGMEHLRLGRYQEAVKAYKRAIQLKPDYAEACYGLGSTYDKLGRYREAVKAYEHAIQLKPDHAWAHYGLGVAYLYLGNSKVAQEQCKILEALDQQLASILSRKITKDIKAGK